jgi:valyl-tRNA synthetase
LQWEDGLLITSVWPAAATNFDAKKAKQFAELQAFITEVRYVATGIGGKQTLLYKADELIESGTLLIQHLAGLAGVQKVAEGRGLRLATVHHEAWLDLDAETLAEHKARLEARLAQTHDSIENLLARLANKNYVEHAPAHIVAQTKEQLAEQQALATRLERELQIL